MKTIYQIIALFFLVFFLSGCQFVLSEDKTYTVTFKDYNDTILDTQTIQEGKAAAAPTEPSREGYTFTGWDTDFKSITEDTIINAVYSIKQYTVNFKNDDGTVLSTQMIDYGGHATPPESPTKEGCTFTGWDQAYDTIKEDLNITATYDNNPYTITFESNGGTLVSTLTKDYQSLLQKPTDPTKEGYIFGGWYFDATYSNPFSFATMPAENITLYAKWYEVPQVSLSLLEINDQSIHVLVKIIDPEGYMDYNSLVANLYQDTDQSQTKISSKNLTLGDNDIIFDHIPSNAYYSISVQPGFHDGTTDLQQLGTLDHLFTCISIFTVSDLNSIQFKPGGTYQLKNVLDLTNENWQTLDSFNGYLYGNGFQISGLTVPLINDNYGKISNLGLNDINITSQNNRTQVGGLVGINHGIIQDVYITGNMNLVVNLNGTSIGGLVGENDGTIERSYAKVNITQDTSPYEVNLGGLVGKNVSNITQSYATGNVTGTGGNSIGGLVGDNYSTNAFISNSYSLGNVTGTNTIVGGLVGINDQGSIKNSFTNSKVNLNATIANDYVAGGFVGLNKGEIDNSATSSRIELTGLTTSLLYSGFSGDYNGTYSFNNCLKDVNQVITSNGVDVSSQISDTIEKQSLFLDPSLFTTNLQWDTTIWNVTIGYLPLLKQLSGQSAIFAPGLPSFNLYGVKDLTIQKGEQVNLLDGITALDDHDGEIPVQVNIVDTSSLDYGTYNIEYTAINSSGITIHQTATLLVENTHLDNNYTLNTLQLIPDLDAPMTSSTDYDDYLFTMLEEGYTSYTFHCNTVYLSCQSIQDQTNDVFDMMFFVHTYYRVEEGSYYATNDSITITLTKKTYSDQFVSDINQKVDDILHEIILPGMTEYDEIKAIHDYIIKHIEYNHACITDQTQCFNSYNAYSVFFEDTTVCDGYSQAFDIMARKLGIETYRIHSIPEGQHAWNVVYINGQWLHIDLTWDDTGGQTVSNEFFLVTTRQLQRNDRSSAHQFDQTLFNQIN